MEKCGSELMVDFLSNAPFAFFTYHHALPSDTDIVGSKVFPHTHTRTHNTQEESVTTFPMLQVFFLKAQYRGGAVQLDLQLVDHVWVTKSEMREYVTEDYFNSVGSILID